MRAAWYEQIGRPEDVLKVGEQPDPVAGPGEILVRVKASAVNPTDEKRMTSDGIRASLGQGAYGGEFPLVIPHSDGAGVVEAVGENVDPSRIGERVWLWNATWERPFGTAAEYVALPSDQAVRLPDSVDFLEAANIGIPAQAAHFSVFSDGPVSGKNVLVTGGAGVVGRYAIQFAKWGGARVLSTVSSSTVKRDLATSAGADLLIDYQTEDVVEAVLEATDGAGVERIVEVEFGANLPVSLAVLRVNGVISAYGSMKVPAPVVPFYGLMFKGHTLRAPVVYTLPEAARAQAISDITQMMESNLLTHNVGRQFTLDQIADAHHHVVDSTKIGSVVIGLD